MRRSFVRLIAGCVVLCWALSFASLIVYARSLSWIEDRAQTDGVFLAYERLNETPPQARAQRLAQMQPHYWVPLTLRSKADAERQLGTSISAGARIPHRVSFREEWYFLAFDDNQTVLAVGPVDPTRPRGFEPIGVMVLIFVLPLLACLLAVTIERALQRVERASDALADGDFSARMAGGGAGSELAARFNAMAERVERLLQSRKELVQAVSHELGSPLSRLRFQLVLLETEPEAARDARTTSMTRELDTLDALVAELLGYAQSDDLVPERRAFDPGRMVHDLAELARLAVDDGPSVTVELSEGLPKEMAGVADPRLFQRAIENLLRNAMRHAQHTVSLELSQVAGALRVTVHDDGPGIPADQRAQVVQPFFRLDADRGRPTGGAGLGLAIVNRIVQQHGGQLVIGTSRLGGAAVQTTWPRQPENPSKPRCSMIGPSGGAVPRCARLSAVAGEPATRSSALRGSLPRTLL